MKHMILFLYVTLIFVAAINSIIIAQTVDENFWVPNNTVFATVRSGDIIYIGGAFTQIGPPTGCGTAIDTSTGNPNLTFKRVNGPIVVAVPDGAGGWYIGGHFSKVGGVTRNNLARINSDGTLDASWNPNVTGSDPSVYALVVSDSTIYVGGTFTEVGVETRNNIAAINATTGQVTSWDPDANSTVFALAVSGSTVYAGGIFTEVGVETRNNIAAINATTGQVTSWNPDANYRVWTLAISGSTVYACGLFTRIGAQTPQPTRNYIAALDATTGEATSWNPNANNWVRTLAISGSTVYVGGIFTSIGAQTPQLTRNYIAALDVETGLATSWNPNTNGEVFVFAISGSTVYVGGVFTSIGGQPRNYIAALDATTGEATSWNPNASWRVLTLAPSGSTIYAGGLFFSIGGVERNRIAAIDAMTGIPTSWNPNVSGESEDTTAYGGWVRLEGEYIDPLDPEERFTNVGNYVNPVVKAIELSGSIVYVGGEFTRIGGYDRNHIAAINATTGQVTSWDPDVTGQTIFTTIHALVVSDSIVYAGGVFDDVGGDERNNIAAIDILSGNVTSWNPDANERVKAIELSGSIVYVGGFFNSIGGQTRYNIAAVDAETGDATDWAPNANYLVHSLAIYNSTIYVGGEFTEIGTQTPQLTRNSIAALDIETGRATDWDPNASGGGPPPATIVYALDVSVPTVYAAGTFTAIGQKQRKSIAALDIETGKATDWDPNPRYPGIPWPSEVYAIAVGSSTFYMGGFFVQVKDKVQSYLAKVTADGATVITTPIESGWQLVSVPVVVDDFSASSIFPTAVGDIYAYVPGSGYVAEDILENGPGYWTNFDYQQSLIFTGLIIDTLSIGIESGWNIIGSISYDVIAADVCTEPSEIISAIYSYDNGYVLLGDGDPIEPGVGYWVNANDSGTVFLSEFCGMEKITAFPQIDLAELDKFIVTDSYGKKQSLYVANIDIDTTLVDFDRSMPPPMPVLGFDARFIYGEFIKAVSVDSGLVDLEIDLESDAYPITLSWELNPENGIEYSFISDSGLGKISQIKVENGQTSFSENSRGSIQLFGKVNESFKLIQIPDQFELLQNYPNPFNPTTTIKYSLPKDGLVSLTVYNAIGERVVELVNGEVKAGYYEVIFNASRLSSGVYFYQIVAGKYMDVKKMILLK